MAASSTTATIKDNLLFPPPPHSVITAPQVLPKASLEPASIQSIINSLSLAAFVEGGYMAETDRNTLEIPSPFPLYPATTFSNSNPADPNYTFDPECSYRPGFDPKKRNASTTIYYLLTGANGGKDGKEGGGSPKGYLHRNRGRIIHTLHRGRGRYVVLHADETPCRVESFLVGRNVEKGEKMQWIVEGGKYKGTFVLPVEDPDGEGDGKEDEMIFISETTVPGWEVFDHDFLDRKGLEMLMEGDEEKIRQLEWLVKKEN
ncbi:RmlC-like cupin domain-containing protein [Pseudoneurospora amorphoporcata]|uniref:RmlC-like cupin domain-containing protein n=1 Tax=Pseudoneurospora amorphoporcata TaxID=241081 RepID=A0AAN6NV90_9PEZI|nr:RmlC-like cupin domain-containing protein [Pseudoneurospora amorphoporcata]